MNKIWSIILFAFVTLFSINAVAQNEYQANWKSLSNYQVPDWFRDAKFGIFIHWGVYSVPAYGGDSWPGWYPYYMSKKGTKVFKHHVETYGPQDKFSYKDFIPMFKGEKFNPDQWAKLFKAAGAKYVVPVAEHHDDVCRKKQPGKFYISISKRTNKVDFYF